MKSNTKAHLRGVWALTSKSVFAVGDQGIVLHYNGNPQLSWSAVPSYNALGKKVKNLRSVHGFGAKVLVVGDENANLACSSTQCDPSPYHSLTHDDKNWYAVWCSGANTCFVGGTSKNRTTGYLYNLTGGIWFQLCSSPGSLLSDHVFALAGYGSTAKPYLFTGGLKGTSATKQWMGGACVAMPSTGVSVTLRGAWTMTGAPVLAVGDKGTAGGTLLSHSNGTWTNQGTSIKVNLRAAWGSAKDRFWVVGDAGHVFHYNGTKWIQYTLPVTNDLHAVHGIGPSDLYAVGNNGTIHRFN